MAIDARAKTQPVRAKPVTDILNAPEVEFIPVTQATCTSRSSAESKPVETDCTIVQVRTIRMVFPFEDS